MTKQSSFTRGIRETKRSRITKGFETTEPSESSREGAEISSGEYKSFLTIAAEFSSTYILDEVGGHSSQMCLIYNSVKRECVIRKFSPLINGTWTFVQCGTVQLYSAPLVYALL